MKARIFVVDDHQLVVDGLINIIGTSTEFELVGKSSNGKKLIEDLSLMSRLPDIILMDIDMPSMNGLDATRIVKKKYPQVKVLILTMHDENTYYNQAIAAQASGFIKKSASQRDLIQALKKVHAGEPYFTEKRPDDKTVTHEHVHNHLTSREIEILKKIALGMSNSEISGNLGISIRTVDTHRTNLKRKLGVHSIAGLVRYAFSKGYLT
jgi:two-component system, NarL family, nitrate/nitrite response regulator NarL